MSPTDEERVLELDPAAGAGIERQFFELGAGQQPIAAKPLDQILGGVAARGDMARGQAVADHRGTVALAVGIAADRGGPRRAVEHAPQRRSAGKFAGLGHNERIARHVVEKAGEQPGQPVRGGAHPHHPAPAGQAQLRRFVGKARRIGGERGTGQIGDAERVAQIRADGTGEEVGALAHQPRIGAVEQHRADCRVGALQKRREPRRGDLGHRLSPSSAGSERRAA